MVMFLYPLSREPKFPANTALLSSAWFLCFENYLLGGNCGINTFPHSPHQLAAELVRQRMSRAYPAQ